MVVENGGGDGELRAALANSSDDLSKAMMTTALQTKSRDRDGLSNASDDLVGCSA